MAQAIPTQEPDAPELGAFSQSWQSQPSFGSSPAAGGGAARAMTGAIPSFAEGGEVDAPATGAADDAQTAGFSSLLAQINKVLLYGYNKFGILNGEQPESQQPVKQAQPAQPAAIPQDADGDMDGDEPVQSYARGGSVQSFAEGGDVEEEEQPNPTELPVPETTELDGAGAADASTSVAPQTEGAIPSPAQPAANTAPEGAQAPGNGARVMQWLQSVFAADPAKADQARAAAKAQGAGDPAVQNMHAVAGAGDDEAQLAMLGDAKKRFDHLAAVATGAAWGSEQKPQDLNRTAQSLKEAYNNLLNGQRLELQRMKDGTWGAWVTDAGAGGIVTYKQTLNDKQLQQFAANSAGHWDDIRNKGLPDALRQAAKGGGALRTPDNSQQAPDQTAAQQRGLAPDKRTNMEDWSEAEAGTQKYWQDQEKQSKEVDRAQAARQYIPGDSQNPAWQKKVQEGIDKDKQGSKGSFFDPDTYDQKLMRRAIALAGGDQRGYFADQKKILANYEKLQAQQDTNSTKLAPAQMRADTAGANRDASNARSSEREQGRNQRAADQLGFNREKLEAAGKQAAARIQSQQGMNAANNFTKMYDTMTNNAFALNEEDQGKRQQIFGQIQKLLAQHGVTATGTTGSTPQAPQAAAPPAPAIEKLRAGVRNDPALKTKFDQIFGEGAAARALGE